MTRSPLTAGGGPDVPSRRWMLGLSVGVTVALLLLGLAAPHFPITGDRHEPWDLAQRGMGFEALKSVPSWWSTVLPVLGALAAVDAMQVLASRLARAGWLATALLLGWLSVDHLVTIHEALGRFRLPGPGPLADNPDEVALAVLGALAGLALLLTHGRRVVLLLVGAAVAYAASVAVDVRGAPVSMSPHHAAMLEVGLSWLGLLLVLWAALCAAPWTRAPGVSPDRRPPRAAGPAEPAAGPQSEPSGVPPTDPTSGGR